MTLFPFTELAFDKTFELFVKVLLFGVPLSELLVENTKVTDVQVQINLHRVYYNFNRSCIELLG